MGMYFVVSHRGMLCIRVPLQYYMVGKSEEQSRVVVGVVTSLHPDMVAVAQSNMTRKLRVVVSGVKII